MQQAQAGCLQYDGPKKLASAWQTPGSYFGSAHLVKVSDANASEDAYGPSFFRPEITGLWAFKYISEGNADKPAPINIPNGVTVDAGNTL